MRSPVLVAVAAALTMAIPAVARADEAPVLFEHVNVVPMDRYRILEDRSVLVADGRIVAIGGTVAAPPGARIVDGQGGYLMPGLADMHVHSANSRDMQVFLANGVTTVLNMGGASSDFVDQVVPAINAGAGW